MPPTIWVYGFNPFDIDSGGNLKELDLTKFVNDDQPNILIELTATHALVAAGSALVSHSCITEKSHTVDCGSPIVQLSANNWYCLALLEDGILLKYDIYSQQMSKLDFLSVENSTETKSAESITHIACDDKVSVAVTSPGNFVFNIPNKTYTFPKHVRIKKVAVGLEHCLLLTGNGDVYSWGCGLRGQLGNGEITAHQEQPQLVEALAGVKIVDVAAGGWHSAAISAFGDVYCWGWNSKGQLGLVDEKRLKGAVFALPQVIEFTEQDENQLAQDVSFEKVHCGSGHTVVVSSKGELYFAGHDLRQRLDFCKVERNPNLCGFKKFENGPKVDGAKLLKSGPNSLVFVSQPSECTI
ncbi:E3 ubiquitin-protein ligase HERC2 [Armigeres subalbatus]|uniref:E3 ubiquitin-protein ligase HERC2 n=1 Tax=Armigeres subalbatus TaxID=124917 RepID=UPI002ED0907C